MRPLICRVIFWCSCFVFVCGRLVAQPASLPPPSPAQVPVYIVEFTQALGPELDRDFDQLNKFTTGLVQLRLLEIPSLTVHRVQDSRACAAGGLQPKAAVQTSTADRGAATDFYMVEGSIKPDLPEIVLNYSVKHCESGKLQTVFQDVQPFTLDQALDEITIVAHAIAYNVEKAIPPTQVDVATFSADSDAASQRNIATDLKSAIVSELEKSSDYVIDSPAEFKIVGSLQGQKQRALVSRKVNLVAQMHVEAHGKTYPLHTVEGTSDQLQKFYTAVSQEISRGLPEVMLAEHLHISGMLESMQTDELFQEANRLLSQCAASETQCASAADAATLITSAAKKDAAPRKLVLLYGKAQMRAGRSSDAIASLEDLRRRMEDERSHNIDVPANEQLELLNMLGDTYRDLGRYDLAEERYRGSLKLDKSQIVIYKSLSAVLQYGSRRVQALEALVAGLQISTSPADAQPLHDSAKDLILAIQDPGEITQSEALLHSALNASAPVANESALLTVRRVMLALDGDWRPENRKSMEDDLSSALKPGVTDPEVLAWVYGASARVELNAGDSASLRRFIDKAEQLPTDRYPTFLHEWIVRISAQDYIDHGQFAQAMAIAEEAYHIQPSDLGTLIMASAAYYDARCRQLTRILGKTAPDPEVCKPDNLSMYDNLEKTGAFSPAEQKEIESLYVQATRLVGPLVAKRVHGSDGYLMLSNHFLGRDRQTVDQFTTLGQTDPKDKDAWETVIYVCSQFLPDGMDCAVSSAQKVAALLPTTGPRVAREFLNIAEVAVMAGNQKLALEWLSIAATQTDMTPADNALLHLYHLWAIALSGTPEQVKSDFDAWQAAAVDFRNQSESLHWVFGGARRILNRSTGSLTEQNIALINSMMDALERPDSKMPAWPPKA